MEDFKAAYLEDWIDTIESLPCELQRNFSLIRELDCMSQENSSETFISSAKDCSAEERRQMLKSLTKAFSDALKHGEDKVNLAIQTYDLVDRHIRRLDADLIKFEEELTMTGPFYNYGIDQMPVGVKSSKSINKDDKNRDMSGKRRRGGAVTGPRLSRRSSIPPLPPPSQSQNGVNSKRVSRDDKQDSRKRGGSEVSEGIEDERANLDPNEPTYCICNNVSYGAMIACDNAECDIEWFHYDCVGLDSPPKGKWYCENCKEKLDM